MHTNSCSFDGCNRPATYGRDRLCHGHRWQQRHKGTLTPISRGEAERFWKYVEKTADCWIWHGSTDAKGYGRFVLASGEKAQAHRWSYEAQRQIPDGLTLDHLCRNTSCVRPSHLEPVTGKVNTLRGGNPTAVNARKTHCVHGHPFSGDNLAIRSDGSRRCRECSRQSQKRKYERRRLFSQAMLDAKQAVAYK